LFRELQTAAETPARGGAVRQGERWPIERCASNPLDHSEDQDRMAAVGRERVILALVTGHRGYGRSLDLRTNG
jgi:hypothetical protein